MSPSETLLPAFFSAVARPFCLNKSLAFSKSPPLSVSAFLHSIIPAPVFSLKFLTDSADIVVIVIQSPLPLPAESSPPLRPSRPLRPWPSPECLCLRQRRQQSLRL